MENGCKGCKYIRGVYDDPTNRCINQRSPRFGEEATTGCSLYEQFSAEPSMSFKEALDILISPQEGAYICTRYKFGKEGEPSRPLYLVSFTDNNQLIKYQEAAYICFCELMDMKERDGDFREEEGKGNG